MLKSIAWEGNSLRIIDQTELPWRLTYLDLQRIEEVYEAIQRLRVRGAPAIGVAAGFGLYLGLRDKKYKDKSDFISGLETLSKYLIGARPTAVNLEWVLNLVRDKIISHEGDPGRLLSELLGIAKDILKDDEWRCEKIGNFGAQLIENNMAILTHCNTGALATAGIGTALGAIYTAVQQGKQIRVFVGETRPLLQGARLTIWELQQAEIPATLITDGMAAFAMQQGKINLVMVGADRISANGDVANKIGTYSLAISSHHHCVPFYVAAPVSSFDFNSKSGAEIPIEERDCREISEIWGKLKISNPGTDCWNPAFDLTPAHLITGIVTDAGIIYPPFEENFIQLNQNTYQN
jgi:methylthioribose-1-phosphate isomerase